MTEKKEIDVGKHVFVPEHRKLSEDEKQEILKKYKLTEKGFPGIKLNDPAIKNLNVEIKDIIEIKRKVLGTDENYLYYRAVI
ncbi:MAG: DNA-directed RNA polymerase subunit H [Candidatus Aenigmarchaeota archaeon]|nr:DNA-directed RNA polymerase subunit H [Candidatus Aenigmarchaeota archaeon]